MTLHSIPGINAVLNASSACFLAAGYYFIRSGRKEIHKLCMLTAFLLSTAFLALYLIFHWKVGVVRFQGVGMIRIFYFTVLTTHSFLAIFNVPLILRTLYLAWQGRFEEHKKAARWAFPSWLYVSVTGVVVYWMLYRL